MNETRLKQIEDRWLNATRLPYEESIVVIRADILTLTDEVRRLQAKEATLDAMVRENEIRLEVPMGSDMPSREALRMDALEARLNALEAAERERKKLTRVIEKEMRLGKPTGLGGDLPTARDRYEKNI